MLTCLYVGFTRHPVALLGCGRPLKTTMIHIVKPSFFIAHQEDNKQIIQIIKTDEPDGNNWAKIKMKKSLLKTSLICLGITLLCGLYSFKTPEGMKSQQRNRTASIVYDTIITLDGEGARCIKEFGEKSDPSVCECVLYVVENEYTNSWSLKLSVSCNCTVIVTYDYTVFSKDDGDVPGQGEIECGWGVHDLKDVSGNYISGNLIDSRCNPERVIARLAPDSNQNQ